MKKVYSLITMAIIAVTSVYLCFDKHELTTLFDANIEALAEYEGSIIVCNSGNCGLCFEEETAWPFYKCNWTGRQADYCDCNKLGYL